MPIRPNLRHHYGRRWRTVTRPAILARAYYECERCAIPDRPMGLKSTLEGAHVNGDSSNDSPTNTAALCHRCHRRHDYAACIRQARETRRRRKDAARGLLALLAEAS